MNTQIENFYMPEFEVIIKMVVKNHLVNLMNDEKSRVTNTGSSLEFNSPFLVFIRIANVHI